MTATVSTLSIICMVISLIGTIAIPVGFLIYFRKKGADILPFFIGCAVLLIFALILEQIGHGLVQISPLKDTLVNNVVALAIYGGLMAGLFEETGRFIAFKTVMKKYRGRNVNALMYGAGHGGFEAFAIVGLTMISNITWAIMINGGHIDQITANVPESMLPAVQAQIDAFLATGPEMYLLGLVERIIAICLHISLSVLVWFAVKSTTNVTVSENDRIVEIADTKLPRQGYLYPLAIFIHAFIDACTVIISRSGMNMVLVEVILACLTAVTAFIALKIWRKNNKVG